MIPKISICITTYNRFDQFLSVIIPKYLEYTKYVDDIVVVDDASDDYDKLLAVYGHFHPIVRVFRQETNVGLLKNKITACAKAKNDWICIMDSDNLAPLHEYFEILEQEWISHGVKEDYIYSASVGLPLFVLSPNDVPEGKIDKAIWKERYQHSACKPWYINNCNFVLHKSLATILARDDYTNVVPYSYDTAFMVWVAMKHNYTLYFVPQMMYHHTIHQNGGAWKAKEYESCCFHDTFNWCVD